MTRLLTMLTMLFVLMLMRSATAMIEAPPTLPEAPSLADEIVPEVDAPLPLVASLDVQAFEIRHRHKTRVKVSGLTPAAVTVTPVAPLLAPVPVPAGIQQSGICGSRHPHKTAKLSRKACRVQKRLTKLQC